MSIQHSFKPRLYQDLSINHAVDILGCNIWAGMGMGKKVGDALHSGRSLHGGCRNTARAGSRAAARG